MKNVDKFYLS